MVAMSVLIGLIILALIVVVTAWLLHRRGADESHSIEGYRHTLETLQEIGSRSARGNRAAVDEGSDLSVSTTGVAMNPATDVPLSDRLSRPDDNLHPGSRPQRPDDTPPGGIVFTDPSVVAFEHLQPDDAGSASDEPGQPFGHSRRSGRRRRDPALSAMNRGPARFGTVSVVGLAAVVIVVVVALVGVATKASSKHPASTATTLPNPTRSSSPTDSRSSGSRDHVRRRSSTTTSTTAPPSFTPTTSTPTSATYVPPSLNYTLTLTTTTGPCWVSVSTSSGASLLSATLAPGQKKSLPVNGMITVILGAPSAVLVSLDSEPVILPVGFKTPFTMTLQPQSSLG